MKKDISDYNNPFEAIDEFEKALAEFTGAKGVVVTDSCTHAIELGLRYNMPKMYATLPEHTYLSIPMTLEKLGIEYMFTEDKWDEGYRIEGSIVYDYARHFAEGMFETDTPVQKRIMCLSFGHGKPLEIGHGGAILTNDREAYEWLKRAVYDGRDLTISPWEDQKTFDVGYHYMMRPEDAVIGLNKLANGEITDLGGKGYKNYPDLREITINKAVTQR